MRQTYPARQTVDQVLSDARHAVLSARRQRDQLAHELRALQADNEALRMRAQRSPSPTSPSLEQVRLETLTTAVEPLAELLDHLGRALAANPDPENPWFVGTAAILARTRASLAGLGVHAVGAVGDTFDPELHEAIGTLRTADLPPGSIVDTVKVGLVHESGRLIRPASVVVAEGGP